MLHNVFQTHLKGLYKDPNNCDEPSRMIILMLDKFEMRILAHFGMRSPPFFKPVSVGYVWDRQLKKKIARSLYIRQKVNYVYLRDKFSEHQIKQNNAI